jgi:hypothetical protein
VLGFAPVRRFEEPKGQQGSGRQASHGLMLEPKQVGSQRLRGLSWRGSHFTPQETIRQGTSGLQHTATSVHYWLQGRMKFNYGLNTNYVLIICRKYPILSHTYRSNEPRPGVLLACFIIHTAHRAFLATVQQRVCLHSWIRTTLL